MKRSQSKDAPSGDLPKRNFLSWNRAVQPRCLRVELADGTFFVLPYQHLVCVRFEPGTDDTISVTISGHEVKITGKNLRELALAFQKFTVDWVKNCQDATWRLPMARASISPASRSPKFKRRNDRVSPYDASAQFRHF
jgi:hypothetical protein